MTQKIGLILGPILFLIFYNLPVEFLTPEADKVIAIAIWMITWWITEAVSISVTALIPLVFFPFLGIMEMKETAANYGSPIVFLFFGGFVMALALENVNLHKRIALGIVSFTGTTPDRVILGFMIATAVLSMWISNTATTVVMLPIGLSVVDLLIKDEDGFSSGDRNFALALMLGIAYAANVGGIATIIGTPPNTVLVGFLEQEYQMDVSFLKWMLMGIPFSTLMIGVIYIVLVKWVYPNGLGARADSRELIQRQLKELGPLSGREKQVLFIFTFTMIMWVVRGPLNKILQGWESPLSLSDAGISLFAAFLLFAFPFKFKTRDFIVEWKDTTRLPWGILILFGGGLALAKGLSNAGVITYIGEAVASQSGLSALLVGSSLIAIMLFMTELMSNVALVAIFAPVMAGIATGLDQNLLHFIIPIAMASSCAFMLPMATPPNAIVFASGYIQVKEMAKAGAVLNIISILILIGFMAWVIPFVFS